MPFKPSTWLIIILTIALPALYGTMLVQRGLAVDDAYNRGHKAGKGAANAEGVKSAVETKTIVDDAEAETPIPVDKAAIMELCKRSSSCRERSRLK